MRHDHSLWWIGLIVLLTACGLSNPEPGTVAEKTTQPTAGQDQWELVYEETFDQPFNEPAEWVEDTYGPDSPYHVGPFDDDGDYFIEAGGQEFLDELGSFRSFRKSYTYGKDDWLTVELYGRDVDLDGTPESGGQFVSANGRAKLISTRNYDGAIIRATEALPSRYRIEVTVSNIDFGGERDGKWGYDGKINGYDNLREQASPWIDWPGISVNGVYFLCITDYARPAPHNNIFIHHHRKVAMDTANNIYDLGSPDGSWSWSFVWNPVLGEAEMDGSHYVGMIWFQGEDFGPDQTGNEFLSYTTDGWQTGPIFVDKYLEEETYVFAIERDEESYTLSVSGKFHHGGDTSYTATHKYRESPVVWHYNQTVEEYQAPFFNQTKSYNNQTYETWPEGSSYPDNFFFGDPHINFYEGTAEYDNLKLYLSSD